VTYGANIPADIGPFFFYFPPNHPFGSTRQRFALSRGFVPGLHNCGVQTRPVEQSTESTAQEKQWSRKAEGNPPFGRIVEKDDDSQDHGMINLVILVSSRTYEATLGHTICSMYFPSQHGELNAFS
jgi:hypothetical protein